MWAIAKYILNYTTPSKIERETHSLIHLSFRVLSCLCFKTMSTCETFHMKMSSACIFKQIKVILIRIVSHLDSLWNRGTTELRNGLFIHNYTPTLSAFPCGITQHVTRMCSSIASMIQSSLEFRFMRAIPHSCLNY